MIPIALFNCCKGQDHTRIDDLLSYPDSIVYTFTPHVVPQADKEPLPPLLFKIKLPPHVLSNYSSGFDAFGFRYSDRQTVYVYIDYYDKNASDTSYRVTHPNEIERLLLDDLNAINYQNKLDIDNNPFSPARETWLIKKGAATILLYNIQKENMPRFLHDAASFTFL
ncbi:MAG TPA: hypothetical protein VHD83_03705 [Puia sp.]|nr:hypothetical protein [Puia sp.]